MTKTKELNSRGDGEAQITQLIVIVNESVSETNRRLIVAIASKLVLYYWIINIASIPSD